MKIGVDATPLAVPRAGVGTYTANLIRGLRGLDRDEVVPLIHREMHPSFAEDFGPGAHPSRAHGISRRPNRTLWMQTTLRRKIRSEGFDVCHFTNSVAPLRCSCPYVVTIHDAGLWLHPEYHYLRRLLALRPLIPTSAHGAAAVVTVSHSVGQELVEVLRLPEARVRVIHQGVSASFAVPPSEHQLGRIRADYGLPERFVLVVGALEPRKNLVRLLEAFAALAAEPGGRGVGLVMVGPAGWKYRPILEAVSRMKRRHPIFLLEPVSTEVLVALYHLATVLAFPSLYEGFGLPLLEAMTCGTPAVTSGRGALAEIAGGAAELVDPLCAESISEGLLRVLDDEGRAADLRERGLARARDFSWDRAARETRDLYEEISAGAGGEAGPGSTTRNRSAPWR
jgi:glycosyltransferase involved in cell wall biosynthesis